ncbi:MAG: SRPBCC family protein [Chloroflexota bacterium]|nr:SRPBCC family protein [Chloroflexota bacterium]
MTTHAPSVSPDGTVRRVAGGHELRFERFLPHPIGRVWAALTESDALAAWLAPGEFDLVPGGRAHLAFANTGHVLDGRVVAVEPPRLLAYTWGEGHGVVRWELSSADGGTRLVLTHVFPVAAEAPSFLAGWHTHLELLALALSGEPASWPWGRWHELHARYAASEATP